MSMLRRAIRYPYNYLLRRASVNMKRYFWDKEYRSGKWDRIDNTAGDHAYPYLYKYLAQGSILDLGCGPGNTANELAEGSYSSYVGIDISTIALQKAELRTQQAGRAAKNRFVNSDFLSYVPGQRFDVILMRESIYHVPLSQVRTVLDHYAGSLSENGVFVVKLVTDNRLTSNARVRIIEKYFDLLEKVEHGPHGLTILVFRPKRQSSN